TPFPRRGASTTATGQPTPPTTSRRALTAPTRPGTTSRPRTEKGGKSRKIGDLGQPTAGGVVRIVSARPDRANGVLASAAGRWSTVLPATSGTGRYGVPAKDPDA